MGFLDAILPFRKQEEFEDLNYDQEEYLDEEEDFGEQPYMPMKPAAPKYQSANRATPEPYRSSKASRDNSADNGFVPYIGTPQSRIVIAHPTTFDDAGDIADQLREHCAVIVNLDKVDTEQGQRLIDFINGVVHALNGTIEHISNKNFVAAPPAMIISDHIREQLKSNGIMPNFARNTGKMARAK
jgi:cell division inhibitor SepF